ncbi:MAG TPA: hypothetical protein VFR54_02045 [Xanthobacteraceae bacterium]|nr:hypothetical protein [Xanthobacteraceae bacterium]
MIDQAAMHAEASSRYVGNLIFRIPDERKEVVVFLLFPEILALSDRILFTRQGKVVEEARA